MDDWETRLTVRDPEEEGVEEAGCFLELVGAALIAFITLILIVLLIARQIGLII